MINILELHYLIIHPRVVHFHSSIYTLIHGPKPSDLQVASIKIAEARNSHLGHVQLRLHLPFCSDVSADLYSIPPLKRPALQPTVSFVYIGEWATNGSICMTLPPP